MEDITNLTFPSESLDLIVSSDVLEHVSDAQAAFRETHRVLRRGGAHVFTVPFEPATVRRAIVEGTEVRHLVTPPEYHADPFDPNGILAFWHFGPDLQQQFGDGGLTFKIVKGPEGVRRSVVWEARKPA
jgi:SAM-dependent methyltransferase